MQALSVVIEAISQAFLIAYVVLFALGIVVFLFFLLLWYLLRGMRA